MSLKEIRQQQNSFKQSIKNSGILAMRKFILPVLFLLLPVISVSMSFAQNVTKIYSSDSMTISKFFKIKAPQAGFDNGYFQIFGYNSLPNVDYRNGNVYRILKKSVTDSLHNRMLRNYYNLCSIGGPITLAFGYALDFTVSELDSNLILSGGASAECEPYEGMGYSLNNGLTGNPIFSQTFMSFVIGMAINPKNDSNMFAAYRLQGVNYIYKTTNRGANWFVTDTLTNSGRAIMKVNPFNPSIVFLTSAGLLRSSTGGYDFTSVPLPNVSISSFEFDEVNNSIYFTSTGPAGGIFKSDIQGLTWTQIFDKTCSTLEIDPLNHNIMFAGTPEAIYRSTNAGANWELYNNAFTPSKNIIGLIKNPDMGDTLLAVTNKAVYRVYGEFKAFTDYNYFPLRVGNSWTYETTYELPPGTNNTKVTIVSDTVINNIKYFKTAGIFPGFVSNIVTVDSLTGNIFCYSESQFCQRYPQRLLMDSLAGRLGDTVRRCHNPQTGIVTDTSNYSLPWQTVKAKEIYYTSLVDQSHTYGKGFGLVDFITSEGTSTPTRLKGCIIDGIMYGDTAAFSPFNTYLPLQVGNSWTYIRRVIPAPDEEITITIIRDTIINGVKYYQTNIPFPTFDETLITLDTITGNIYTFNSGISCSYSTQKKLKDSLAAKKDNTFKGCDAGLNGKCLDTNSITIFGRACETKNFLSPYYSVIDCSQRFAKNFGIVSAMAIEVDIISYGLKQCTIDGIIYSDSLKSISGTVKFSDNSQPASNGYVKALKLNTSTGNIVTYDSIQIGTNGSYNLHIPSDLYYIVAYPNSEKQADFVPTYFPSTISWQSAVKVNSSNNPSNVNISVYRKSTMGGAYSINGWVTAQTNSSLTGLKDAIVYIKQGNIFRDYFITQSSGQYTLNSLLSGNYEIAAERLGYANAQQNVSLTNGNLENINFALVRVGIQNITNIIPDKYSLYQNYPNPFNPVTNIKFDIPKSSFVTIKIYNVLGKECGLLLNENKAAGSYVIDLDASSLTSGVYFYRLETESFTETKRMVVLK